MHRCIKRRARPYPLDQCPYRDAVDRGKAAMVALDALPARADSDWVIKYGDREHVACRLFGRLQQAYVRISRLVDRTRPAEPPRALWQCSGDYDAGWQVFICVGGGLSGSVRKP